MEITKDIELEPQKLTARERKGQQPLEIQKLEKRLCREVGRAIIDYNMIEEGDRVMAVSYTHLTLPTILRV